MTPEELNAFLADLDAKHGKLEHRVDRERREIAAEERRREREREQGRNLTDFEMARWRAHFEQLIDERLVVEQARMGQVLIEQKDVTLEALGEMLAELRHDFEKSLDDLRQEIAKRAAIVSGDVIELPNPLLVKRHDQQAG